MNIETALIIALYAHHLQTDKCGSPYIEHPLFVYGKMETEDEKVVALLHDVVEDSNITIDDLVSKGLNETQYNAIDLLTHKNNVPYMDYIRNISSNPISVRVKLADLEHNMKKERIEASIANGADQEKINRKQLIYKQAYEFLSKI